MAFPSRPPPPFLLLHERNALLSGPMAHLRMLRDGCGTRLHLQSLAGLFNLGSVAAHAKRDARRSDIFLWAQTQLMLIVERTLPEATVVLADDEYEALRKALLTMDAWLVTLPRARLLHASAHIEKARSMRAQAETSPG